MNAIANNTNKVVRSEATFCKEYNCYYADLVLENGQIMYYCYNTWTDPKDAIKFAERYVGKNVDELSTVSWCLLQKPKAF